MEKTMQYKEQLLTHLIQVNGDAQANLMLKDIIILDLEQQIKGLNHEIYVLNEMIKDLKKQDETTEE